MKGGQTSHDAACLALARTPYEREIRKSGDDLVEMNVVRQALSRYLQADAKVMTVTVPANTALDGQFVH